MILKDDFEEEIIDLEKIELKKEQFIYDKIFYQNLPPNLSRHILSFLNIKELANISMVSKEMKSNISSYFFFQIKFC